MFNKDFYPTPTEVMDQMAFGIDLFGKNVFEPSSGSGNIIEYCKQAGAKVYACELDPKLAIISAKKADVFIKHDFMQVTADEIAHINIILMNPPFSADEKHIIHAYNIAPEGCVIVSLCNSNTITNIYSVDRKVLKTLISDYGKSQYIGSAFSDSERETDVEVSIVTIYKPMINSDTEFDGFFDMNDKGEENGSESGVMQYNEIRNIVNRYVESIKLFDEVENVSSRINGLIQPINGYSKISFGAFIQNKEKRSEQIPISRNQFKKELQKSAWREIFSKLDIERFFNSKIKQDLNKFIEMQENVPFTMNNIYKMVQLVMGTQKSRFEQVLCQAFDRICEFSNENNTFGEGWKTNSNFLIKTKIYTPTYL